MGIRPGGMERWRVVGIFKEAARLLHKHYRLFMPFFLAFYLPASILAVFENAFLSPNVPYSPHTSFVKAGAAYASPQVGFSLIHVARSMIAEVPLPCLLAFSSGKFCEIMPSNDGVAVAFAE